jgi:hypothetical protein
VEFDKEPGEGYIGKVFPTRQTTKGLSMAAAQPAPSKPRKHWAVRVLRWLMILIVLIALLFGAYVWTTLHWSYSHGERAGYVQKFSKKGWVAKTWEGELTMISTPGAIPEKFFFTVREDSTATKINASLGKRVSLLYDQHVGVPTTLFGETEYFVSDVKVIE